MEMQRPSLFVVIVVLWGYMKNDTGEFLQRDSPVSLLLRFERPKEM